MRILISNDDGIDAPGIKALTKALAEVADVWVVAPDRDYSGASSSLTLDMPIRVRKVEGGHFRVSGTPTDCVHLAVTGLFDITADMVVSGINQGANMGDDVIYSGTVAAAIEGRFLGLPAIAISLCNRGKPQYFESAGKAAAILVKRLLDDPLPADTILNVNVPDIPWSEMKGFEVTRLGRRHMAEPAIEVKDPRGRRLYWIGPAGKEEDAGAGTDFNAVRNGKVSISPIHIDLTRYQALEKVSGWVDGLNNSNA
ncbi:MAG: 5'/3'-nucleotidase SurE [bacterium]